MKLKVLSVGLLVALMGSAFAQIEGVSWFNFQEERWKTVKAAMKAALAKAKKRKAPKSGPNKWVEFVIAAMALATALLSLVTAMTQRSSP
jgi:hypothetical protein